MQHAPCDGWESAEQIAFGSERLIVAALAERGDAVQRASARTPVFRRAIDRVYTMLRMNPLAPNSFDTAAVPVRVAKKHRRLAINDAGEIARLEPPPRKEQSSDGMIFASHEFRRGLDGPGSEVKLR
jgi:hypothetical protein